MTNPELFILGLAVTLLTAAALAPLIWAAVLDGRYNDEQQQLYRAQARRSAPAAVPVRVPVPVTVPVDSAGVDLRAR